MRTVDEGIPYGVYVWQIDGREVIDEDGNHLVAPARRGDMKAIHNLTRFVREQLGITEGGPKFKEGVRPVSQAEYEDQLDRMMNGEVADPYDLGNLIEDYKYQKGLE
jgi:hypothetical protein